MGRRGHPLSHSRPGRDLGELYPKLYRALRLKPNDLTTERGPPARHAAETEAAGSAMTLRDRIGVDVGRKLRLEDAVAWAAAHGVRLIDVQLEPAPTRSARSTPRAP